MQFFWQPFYFFEIFFDFCSRVVVFWVTKLLPNQPHKHRFRTMKGLTSWHDCLRFDFQDTMALGKWLGDIFLKSSGLGNGLEICFLGNIKMHFGVFSMITLGFRVSSGSSKRFRMWGPPLGGCSWAVEQRCLWCFSCDVCIYHQLPMFELCAVYPCFFSSAWFCLRCELVIVRRSSSFRSGLGWNFVS